MRYRALRIGQTTGIIRIIAEGHADLNRKLDEALKIENEKEVFKVRLNYLEGEMAEVKEWISRFEKTA